MVDNGFGPCASEAALQAASVGPQMSKSERLHRWADNLELRKRLDLTEDGGFPGRHERLSTPAGSSSPLTVASEDWAFQAEGLQGDRVGDALAFFDLSEHELQRIVGPLDDRRRTIPAAVAAERIRSLANQVERTTVPLAHVLVTGASVAAFLGLALVAS